MSDPPVRDKLEACAAHVARSSTARGDVDAIGVAGTVVTAARISVERRCPVHRHRLSALAVLEVLGHVASLPLADREHVPGLEPARSPVIVAGLVVLHEILARYGLAEIEVSERDLLHGAAIAAAELPEAEEGLAPPGAYTCC